MRGLHTTHIKMVSKKCDFFKATIWRLFSRAAELLISISGSKFLMLIIEACVYVYLFHPKYKCDKINFYNWTHVVCFASYNSDASVANYELLLAVWGTNLWCFTDSKVTGKSIASTSVLFRQSIQFDRIYSLFSANEIIC